ncbi:hypothetical protein Zmor_005783 [Zophobas morio]|uniref:CRAL-TRIO domain-containing protein n=1 Tax=Zophobas morio TaxID=2755281 RepID=A0AA38MMD6_9CUCU|nr:hypothetical protein Zmor_005783 [Zophobas morio]
MEKVKASIFYVPLPKLTKEHYRVFFYKTRDIHVAENVEVVNILRLVINVKELQMIEDVTYGDVYVFDGKNSTLRLMLKVTPVLIYNAMIVIYKQVFSNRLKAVYIINAPPYTEKLVAVLKSILKPKLMERIHFCENSDVLVEKIGKEILPVDYGGEGKSLKELQEMLYQKFNDYDDYFTRLDTLRINDDLKPQRLKNDEMFGPSGNFKKLEID